MAHTYTSSIFHVVFSTRGREPIILAEARERIWRFIGGIARQNDMKTLAIGGTADHVHVLISLPATITLAKAVQLIKGGSSKWIHETFPILKMFAWQDGYGAFSVSVSHVEETIAYILHQEKHHRRRSFQEEFIAFLKKHDIEYDPRFVWG